jgi:hypothetical protein
MSNLFAINVDDNLGLCGDVPKSVATLLQRDLTTTNLNKVCPWTDDGEFVTINPNTDAAAGLAHMCSASNCTYGCAESEPLQQPAVSQRAPTLCGICHLAASQPAVSCAVCCLAAVRLLEFKDGLYDPLQALASWQLGSNPCGPKPWSGVVCANGWVVAVRLKEQSLLGPLTPRLLQVSHLQELHLQSNMLTGQFRLRINAVLENLKFVAANSVLPANSFLAKHCYGKSTQNSTISGAIMIKRPTLPGTLAVPS